MAKDKIIGRRVEVVSFYPIDPAEQHHGMVGKVGKVTARMYKGLLRVQFNNSWGLFHPKELRYLNNKPVLLEDKQ